MAEITKTITKTKTSGRQSWVDAVKGIAIIAVVLLHSDYSFYSSEWLPLWSLLGNSWHVGVFFMVSGFFIKPDEPLRTSIKKNFRGIYLKLIAFYLAAVGLHNLFIDLGFYAPGQIYGSTQMVRYSLADICKKAVLAILGAGREPIVSPLWFVYVLFAARIALSAIFLLTDRLLAASRHKEALRALLLLALCIGGHALTSVAGIAIPRYGNLFSATWLIYLGYALHHQASGKWQAEQRPLPYYSQKQALAGFAAYYLCTVLFGPIILMTNEYHNVVQLTLCVGGMCVSLSYLCQRFESTLPVKALAAVGRQSFSIMALHLLCFKFATLALRAFGTYYPLTVVNSPAVAHFSLALLYTLAGVLLPLLLATLPKFVCRNSAIRIFLSRR